MKSIFKFIKIPGMFNKLYSQMIMEVANKYEMNKVEIDILLFLKNNPMYDTARDIVELRGIAKSYVSKSIDNLVFKKYITLHPDDNDRRIIHLKLEPSADEVLSEGLKAQQKYINTIYKEISPEEKESLKNIMIKITANIEEALK